MGIQTENNDWYPSKREYDPGIKEKQWEELVRDESIFTKNSLITFACIQNATCATCAGMEQEFGHHANFYNTNVSQTGKRIAKMLKIPLRENGDQKYWPVCCLVRRTGDGHSEFKIRPELEAALNKTGILKGVKLMEEGKRFWSGGIKWDGEDKFQEFFKNKYWQIGWNKGEETKGAKQAWKNIESVQIGDYLSFHGHGGQNDLKIYLISKVIDKDENRGILYIEPIEQDNLFHGKAPKLSKGNWFGTLLEVSGDEAIKEIFGIALQGDGVMNIQNKKVSEQVDNYTSLLTHTHNLIFHGAPGTGKTHLAKEIAKAMRAETAFVQFHPSYDYTDFVEGLRPVPQDDAGQIGFELRDGVFKTFCERALENLLNSQKTVKELQSEKV